MATVVNDGDLQLEGTSPRTLTVSNPTNIAVAGAQGVVLEASSQVFQIAKTGTISPASITLTAHATSVTGVTLTIASGGGTMSVTPALTAGQFTFTSAQMTTDAVEFMLSGTSGGTSFNDTLTVVKVREGSDSFSAFLTNEASTLPADTTGVPLTYSGASGNMIVYLGGNDVSALSTFSIPSGGNPNGLTYTLQASGSTGGAFAITGGLTSDTATLTIQAVYATTTLTKVFTLSRVKTGSAGSNACPVFLFQTTTTATPPTLPSATVTYTFATAVATGMNNGWAQSLPPSASGFRWITSASALSSTATDTIGASEWATPALLSSDGAGQFTIGTTGGGTASVTGNTITKTSATTGTFDTFAFSLQQYAGGAHMSAVIPDTNEYCFGLSTGQISGLYAGGFPRIDYSITTSGLTWSILEGGFVTGATGDITAGDTFYVLYDNVAVRYYQNSTLLRTTFIAGLSLYLGVALKTINTRCSPSFGPTGQSGVNGLNTAFLTLYQRAASAPAVPSATVTYTFASSAYAGVNNGWSTTIPSGTQPLWATTATAVAIGTSDTVGTGEWATPVIFAQNGNDASVLTLSSSAQTFTYNNAGTAYPSSQSISLTANLVNISSTAVTWTPQAYNAAGTLLGTVAYSGSGTSITISESQFSANAGTAYVNVTASIVVGGVTKSDATALVKVSDGKNSVVGFLTNEGATVAAASDGTVASFAAGAGNYAVFDGLTNVTTGHSVAYSVASSTGVTMSIDASSGAYSVSAMSADTGFATLQAVYNGVTIAKTYTIAKSRAGQTGTAGMNGTNGAIPFITTIPVVGPVTYDAVSGSSSGTVASTTFTPASDGKVKVTATFSASSSQVYSGVGPFTLAKGIVNVIQSGYTPTPAFGIIRTTGSLDSYTISYTMSVHAGVSCTAGLYGQCANLPITGTTMNQVTFQDIFVVVDYLAGA